jgi:uncharacterized protein
MEQGPPQFVDPKRLAKNKDGISGSFDIARMQGLCEILSGDTGSIRFELNFDTDENGRVHVSGEYSTELVMQCQRCLKPMQVAIGRNINVTLVADEAEATELSREVEPLLVSGKEISLVSFFEDELLLALPLAPNHDTEDCHAEDIQNGAAQENRQRPFAILKDLKLKNSKN